MCIDKALKALCIQNEVKSFCLYEKSNAHYAVLVHVRKMANSARGIEISQSVKLRWSLNGQG